MDQLASSHGRKGFALLIDCRSLEVEPIPLDTSEVVVVVCDTRVKHQLATSAYNERHADCERAVELLSQSLPGIKALRDVSLEQLQRYENDLPERLRRRARHVVTEDARTLAAVAALRAGNIEELGALMWQSHASLRDDYEVSCSELDALVEIASRVDGVIGARMTGGGFGGCTVTLVHRNAVEEFMTTASNQYKEKFEIELATYVVEASEGAREITED